MALKTASTAPHCDICDHAHWKHEPHVWPRDDLPERASEMGVEPKAAARIGREPAAPSRSTGSVPPPRNSDAEKAPKKSKAAPPDHGDAAAILAAIREKTRLRVTKYRASKKGGG